MKRRTRELWSEQDQHKGDRWRLFRAVGRVIAVQHALYPGSFVDAALSFLFPNVTYVDTDDRAAAFFADVAGVREIIAAHPGGPPDPEVRFIHGDYRDVLDLPDESFDLLVSLYAGFVSEHCTRQLRVGGALLANSSHGDIALASIDPRYELSGVLLPRAGEYRVSTDKLDSYLVPKTPITVTKELLHSTGRGILYTRSPSAYLFTRVQ